MAFSESGRGKVDRPPPAEAVRLRGGGSGGGTHTKCETPMIRSVRLLLVPKISSVGMRLQGNAIGMAEPAGGTTGGTSTVARISARESDQTRS